MSTIIPTPHATTRPLLAVGLVTALALTGCQTAETTEEAAEPSGAALASHVQAATPEEAGRYLVVVGGCNDCHTPGYMEPDAAVPESEWLVGSPVGFRGPWGTSYPSNLRLTANSLNEDQWVARLYAGGLPPMPWINAKQMSDADARAVHRYLRSLGPAGVPAPRPVAADVEPETPYIDFVPKHMERLAAPPVPDPS